MTVALSLRKTGPTPCNGSQTIFSYDFKIITGSDLLVLRINRTTFTITLPIFGVDYTVQVGVDGTGTYTYTTPPPGTDDTIALGREANTQAAPFNSGNAFFQTSTQEAIDRIVRLLQQLQEQVNRCLKINEFLTVLNDALPIIQVADIGKALTAALASPQRWSYTQLSTLAVATTSYINTLLAQASEAAVHDYLNLQPGVDIISKATFDAHYHDRWLLDFVAIAAGSGNGDVAFTDFDLTPHTEIVAGDVARVAHIRVRIRLSGSASSIAKDTTIKIRKNGTAPSAPWTIEATWNPTGGAGGDAAQQNDIDTHVHVPCDAGEIVEYEVVTNVNNGASDTWNVQLMGYGI